MDMNSEFDSSCGSLYDCNHCGQLISANEETRTTLEINDFGGIGVKEVQIIDAISYIYGISWNDLQTETPFNLCKSCALLLSDNYTSHKRFESVSHPTSVIRKINSFRQEQWHKIQRNKTGEQFFFSSVDNDYHNEEDLADSFNFDDQCNEIDDQVGIEDKYTPTDDESSSQQNVSIFSEQNKSSTTKPDRDSLITRTSLRSQRQVVIKLERLTNEDINHYNIRQKKAKISQRIRKPIASAKIKKSTARVKTPKKTIGSNSSEKILSVSEIQVNPRNGKRNKYGCKVCGKKFNSRYYYRLKHLPKHYGKHVKKECSICGKILTSYDGFAYHMKVTHADEKEKEKLRFPCEICGEVIYSLKWHMKKMHSGSREIYKCATCDKEYLTKISYEDHILTHSEKLVPYLCGQCGKTYNTKSRLVDHEKTHSAEKKYSCDTCPLKFRTSAEFKNHLLSHSTERKHVCEECGKTFKYRPHFISHMKIHKEITEKGEMNVKCEECGKFFKHSLSLYKHKVRLHRPDLKKNVYKCSFCGKILCSQTNLTVHENLHKNNPEYQPRKKQTWQHKIDSQNNVNFVN